MRERADSRTSEMLRQLLPKSRTNTDDWAKESGTALIIAEEKSLQSTNAKMALCMAVNLLSRLSPVITQLDILVSDSVSLSINIPLFEPVEFRGSLKDFINRLQPYCKVEFVDITSGRWDAALSIGDSNGLDGVISIASDGWVAYVSTKKLLVNFTDNTNPIGAYAAACIGGMEVFKKIFLKKVNLLSPEKDQADPRWRLKFIDGQIGFSTFDYKVDDSSSKNPPLPSTINLEDLWMIGLGAGGGASAYSLASVQGLEGHLNLIDPDEVKPVNMNRYIYALNADAVGYKPKVEAVKELFKKLEVQAYPYSYQEFKESHKNSIMDFLISTVDTKETRRDIQWDMPRVILDAAVISTEFYVRRVDIGKSPCMLCTHKPEEVERSTEEILSKVIGLGTDEIVRLRSTNACLTQDHVDRMKKSSETHGFIIPSVGEHFNDWLQIHCGELASPIIPERIPLPFATVLPGILLAGEVIKEYCFPYAVIQNCYAYDMINVPRNGPTLLRPIADCIFCSDLRTNEIFQEKFGKSNRAHCDHTTKVTSKH